VPARLVKALSLTRSDWDLDNLGATMNTSREGVARLRACSRPADLLIINFGLVDAWVTSAPWLYVPYFPDNVIRKWSRKILKSVKRRLRSQAIRRLFGSGPV